MKRYWKASMNFMCMYACVFFKIKRDKMKTKTFVSKKGTTIQSTWWCNSSRKINNKRQNRIYMWKNRMQTTCGLVWNAFEDYTNRMFVCFENCAIQGTLHCQYWNSSPGTCIYALTCDANISSSHGHQQKVSLVRKNNGLASP